MKRFNFYNIVRMTVLFILIIVKGYSFSQAQANMDEVINIPVIVHVIYDDKDSKCDEPGANQDQNLDRTLILSELKDLHEDFLLLKKDTSEVLALYKPLISNPHINFYLDTTYNTNADRGIIRIHNIHNKNWTKVSPVIDNKRYLNIYIVNYTHSYTSSNHVWDTPNDDAIYLYFCWVGRGYKLLTHEAGHWLGLLHLWGTGTGTGDSESCTVGDGIADTHPQKNATDVACDSIPKPRNGVVDQSCDNQPSNYNNFMDYSGARKMFTKGQVDKMRENLFTYRSSLVDNSRKLTKP